MSTEIAPSAVDPRRAGFSLFRRFEHNQAFSETEGWMLFRLAAIGEAVGWTLLITGIGLTRYVLHGNQIPVLAAGQIHGTLFIIYMVAAAGLYPTLGKSRKWAVVALIASVPPYGSIIFEQCAQTFRSKELFEAQRACLVLALAKQEQ